MLLLVQYSSSFCLSFFCCFAKIYYTLNVVAISVHFFSCNWCCYFFDLFSPAISLSLSLLHCLSVCVCVVSVLNSIQLTLDLFAMMNRARYVMRSLPVLSLVYGNNMHRKIEYDKVFFTACFPFFPEMIRYACTIFGGEATLQRTEREKM